MGAALVQDEGQRRTITVLRCSDAALREAEEALATATPTSALRGLARAKTNDSVADEEAKIRAAADAALCSALADLSAQGWWLRLHGRQLSLCAPSADAGQGETPVDVKARIRRGMEALRAEALAEPPTAEFIRRMETRRPAPRGRVSVLDLVDNGGELAEHLRSVAELAPIERERRLDALIRPRVQPVFADARCEETDLLLMDVWRYFRLTWALPYRSTPGRTFPFLVRNDARPRSPIMGIGALASPVAQLTRRDAWIGWTVPKLIERLRRDLSWWPRQLGALRRVIAQTVRELRIDDILLAATQRGGPLREALLKVSREAADRRRAALQPRRGSPQQLPVEEDMRDEVSDGATDSSASPASPSYWREASEDELYVSKRARVLAELLEAHRVLADGTDDGGAALARLESDEEFRHAVAVGLRECRKAGIASRVLDLQVCGAIAPYGPLLAGKLVALVVGSRELLDAYQQRYGDQVSDIASRMAGREVRRPADYCAVTTTSLYGVASSQYNRLALTVPCAAGVAHLKWHDLGHTTGFGTLHLSRATLDALTRVTEAVFGGTNVTYRFGEGTSPTFRQAREALELLVSSPNAILRHEAPRRVYGFATSESALDSLCLGDETAPKSPSTVEIANAWRKRWLLERVRLPDVLSAVSALGPDQVKARLENRDETDPQLGFF